ncbi:Uncharacterized protein ToN1_21990 [Aromatoleum petrolei]|nr:Uncharacterized protein ToN1_21990 [Aromatoleum petrolei]
MLLRSLCAAGVLSRRRRAGYSLCGCGTRAAARFRACAQTVLAAPRTPHTSPATFGLAKGRIRSIAHCSFTFESRSNAGLDAFAFPFHLYDARAGRGVCGAARTV